MNHSDATDAKQASKQQPTTFLISILLLFLSPPVIQGSFPFWSMETVSSRIMVVFLGSFILLTSILKAFRATREHFFFLFFFFKTKVMEAAALGETNPFPSEVLIMQLCLSSYKARNIAAAKSATSKCSEPFMHCHISLTRKIFYCSDNTSFLL